MQTNYGKAKGPRHLKKKKKEYPAPNTDFRTTRKS